MTEADREPERRPCVRGRSSRILTVPNVITFVRLACLPLYLVISVRPGRAVRGGRCCSAVLGATDWVDGYVARHFHQVSTLGKVLDPVADRLLFFVGVGGILVDGPVPRCGSAGW